MRRRLARVWSLRQRAMALMGCLVLLGVSPLFARPPADRRWLLCSALLLAVAAQALSYRVERRGSERGKDLLGPELLLTVGLAVSLLLVGDVLGLDGELREAVAASV